MLEFRSFESSRNVLLCYASLLERVQGSIGSREVRGDINATAVASPHDLLALSSLSEEVVHLSVGHSF